MSKYALAGAGLVLLAGGWLASQAQDAAPELAVSDSICTFFGPQHDQFVPALQNRRRVSPLTEQVVAMLAPASDAPVAYAAVTGAAALPSAPGGSRTDTIQNPAGGVIDKYIFQKMGEAGVAPAPPTTDTEFLRRVTLDLTGRIPTPEAIVAFVSDTSSDKRAKMIDQLLTRPEWLDKWTMWFGDLYENNSTNVLNARRFISGVLAFNDYIRTSLSTGKPYDQMAREMISATGTDSYEQGDLNFLVGGVMGMGPVQDIFDKQTAVVAEKFLGIAHMDCLLCHNGRGHLDSLSLWGYYTSRQQAWGMASFMSHTATLRTPVAGANNGQPYYWALQNDIQLRGRRGYDYTRDYPLNTQTGNRPPRGELDSTQTVAPMYIFDEEGPNPGEPYRAALARKITSDKQFARAIVNYLWEYFFGIGIVSPSNQFDPARLDPDNPPSDCPLEKNPCELQPSHPQLLNELAQEFIDGGYNLKSLMREIANSRAYELSARYEGAWDPSNERLFARKLVRRLWSEEVHDAIVQSYGVPVTYRNRNWGPVNWAMQLPEPFNTPGGSVTTFLDAFLRGNRDDDPRRGDPSISQALALMNDNFVMSRIGGANAPPNSLLRRLLPLPDDQLVTGLYLAILSRFPTQSELSVSLANLQNNRNGEAAALVWTLYNRVDFLYNY